MIEYKADANGSIVDSPENKTYGDPVPVYRSTVNYYRRKRTYSPLQRRSWAKWSRLSNIRRNRHFPVWKYRKDAVRLGSLSDQLIYLFDHDLTSVDDVKKRLTRLSRDRGNEAARERRLCRMIIRENEPAPDKKAEDSDEIQMPAGNRQEDIMNEPGAYEAPMPFPETIKLVYLNKSLFGEADLTEETFTARIPGTADKVRLFSADSRIYNDGAMISSYIYPEASYCVVDEDGRAIRRITGEKLAGHFKAKDIERKERQDIWKTKSNS